MILDVFWTRRAGPAATILCRTLPAFAPLIIESGPYRKNSLEAGGWQAGGWQAGWLADRLAGRLAGWRSGWTGWMAD